MDDVVLFKLLSLEEITKIVDLLLVELNERLVDRKVEVKLTSKSREWIAEKGYDPTYGARPLKRFLQKQVENRLARSIISGDLAEGGRVQFEVKDETLEMEVLQQ